MVNIIKEEIEIEESLESRLRVICDFCNTTPTIIWVKRLNYLKK